MTEKTPVLDLFLIKQNQLQKEITINEAIIRLDAMTNRVIKSVSTTTAPESPEDGDLYFVPELSLKEWSKYKNHFALYNNGWRYFKAKDGFFAWVKDHQAILIYFQNRWVPINGVDESSHDSTEGK